LAEGLVARFPGQGDTAVGILAGRLKAYTLALHGGLHPEDPHLALADAFTRFCGAADDRALVTLCLEACKGMHAKFIGALTDFGLAPRGPQS
jgi:hypothetical protein